jgi:hypothetical protein
LLLRSEPYAENVTINRPFTLYAGGGD